MTENLTEKEQLEQARKWWDENGRFVITGIVLGVALLVGWNYWKSYKLNYANQASALHEQLMQAVTSGDTAAAVSLADQIATDYGSSPYADQAPLALAKLHIANDDLDAAAVALESALDANGELGMVARLRLARIRLGQARADDALALVNAVSDSGKFSALLDELRGDAHAALGALDAARAAYDKALENPEAVIDRNYVEMKRAALGLGAAKE